MKQINNSGSARLTIVVITLGIITIALAALGFIQENGAKKLFTAPPAETKASASTSGSILSNDDQALASTNVSTIDFSLEAYFAVFSYYPGSIAPSEFASLASSGSYSGTNPVTSIQTATTKPSGVTYDYTPTPAGCTTDAKNCLHFTLVAKDKQGNMIGQQQVSTH